MTPTARFVIFIVVSIVAFVALLRFVLRHRAQPPAPSQLLVLTLIVVVGGMVFAKYGNNFGMPWWIYYTVPALLTLFLPTVVLRMGRGEAIPYLCLSFLVSPAIHITFSLLLGWKEYMPFIPIPSLTELFR